MNTPKIILICLLAWYYFVKCLSVARKESDKAMLIGSILGLTLSYGAMICLAVFAE